MDAYLLVAPDAEPHRLIAGTALFDHAVVSAKHFGASRVVAVSELGDFSRPGIDASISRNAFSEITVPDTLVMSATRAHDRRIERAFVSAPFHGDDALRFVKGLDDTDAGLVRACGAAVPLLFAALAKDPVRWSEPAVVADEVATRELVDVVHLPKRLSSVAVVDAKTARAARNLLSDGVFARLARLLRSR